MKTEKQKMVAGEAYDPMDAQLHQERRQARLWLKAFNDMPEDREADRMRVLRQLIPNAGAGLGIQPPFYCDYGSNITIGDRVFFNFNCVILDVAPVHIGSRVMFGPAVQVYTATHPLEAAQRSSGVECGKPIRIGDDVWIGGGAVVCPGVSIGSRSVIGAGAVVTRDVPDGVFAAGNPCRVIRTIQP